MFEPGTRVVIAHVKFASHANYIGRQGTIERFIKSRGYFKVRLDNDELWHAFPENLLAL